MKKADRQKVVANIIETQVVQTQDQLLQELEKAGFQATQATVSRDIREMRIVKSKDSTGISRYTILKNIDEEKLTDKLNNMVKEVGISVTRVMFMNVIKTLPSNGNLLAALIDDANFPQVVGTVAGHDTIVVISPDVESAEWFYSQYHDALLKTK
ncbi:ArgR family transcriptional regulator [Lacticaseibacillus pabuli]|uniref:Arginine repressor n=1 Tax=Lacticaseibacillus pabuli TaxID=3025672 RepID=A0ABY7WTM9_9LACO|nr:ArgR family transcriptional regulator [Lacticaseibacillus sp. KACC 23028]WDF83519.1 ArgR family transcriptional regulator [Lacticaseibacillus sp. KACC 23028]